MKNKIIIDFIKNLYDYRYSITHRFLGHRVVFHHVPKCAGTSVSRSLRIKYFLSQESIAAPATADVIGKQGGFDDFGDSNFYNKVREFRINLMHYSLWKGFYFVGGHVPFNSNLYEYFSSRYKFITVLRNPIDRYISEYLYNFSREHHAKIETNIYDYMETPIGIRNAHKYCDYLHGGHGFVLNQTDSYLHAAINNLSKFDVIGFTDEMNLFESRLRKSLNIRITFGKLNQMKISTDHANSVFNSEVRNKIRKLCQNDIEIYNYAKKIAARI